MIPFSISENMTLRRIKARTSDIFQGKVAFTVAATEPLDFPAAEKPLAIV